ncbi:MAG: ABC transporter substrate-binding protein, partial [Deinococcus sp.]|nr:ABC transporter substrate-binding protein [Deinococcus sp.]
MKRLASWLTALLVVIFAGSGLAQDRTSTLIYGGDWSDLITLDPGVSYEFTGGLVTDNLYETLVKFEGTDLSTLKPGLAEKWKVENLGTSWKVIFNLRKGAKFSTGREVTSKDVVYSFDRAIALKGPGSFLFTEVANIKQGSTKALDPYTVEVTLPKTASPQAFLNLLTFNIGGIVDSEEVKAHEVAGDFGKAWLTDHSAGSGPFVAVRWERNSQVVLEANPNARLKPKLSRIVMRYIQEPAAQRVALESGEIDIAENLTPEMLKAFSTNPKFKIYKSDNLRLRYLGMNSGEGSPFADPRVRQAVRYAVNQDEIINGLLLGAAKKVQTIIPAGLFGHNPSTYYKYDPALAKRLLAAAGYPNGFTFEFLVSTAVCDQVPCADLAAKIQSDLAKVGLKAEI